MSSDFRPGVVSVIVATYNRAGLLGDALDSVWAQSYRPIELIIVDDGSTDNTRPVAAAWTQAHSTDANFRVQYLYQENAGLSAARNFGLINSCGEYLQFLDSDDLLHPQRLERIVAVFTASVCDYIYTGFENFCARCGETISRRVPEAEGDPLELYCRGRLYINSLLTAWRRSFMLQVGPLDEELYVGEDNDYAIRALLTSRRGRPVPEVLARARRGGGDNLTNRLNTLEGHESRLQWETMLCRGISQSNVTLEARQALASKLYVAGIFTYPEFPLLGRQFGELAEGLGCGPAGVTGRRLRRVWRMGRFASRAYLLLARAKNLLRPLPEKAPHKCRTARACTETIR